MAKASTRNSVSSAASNSGFILKAALGGKKRVVVTRPQSYEVRALSEVSNHPSVMDLKRLRINSLRRH